MRILITGSSGFIGSHLFQSLKNNNQIIPFTRPQSLSNLVNLLSATKNIDLIIHTAAHSSEDFYKCMNNNVMGTINLVEAANINSVKGIIYLSALRDIYDFKNAAVVEEDSIKSMMNDVYKDTKYIGERIVSYFKGNTIILRIGGVYGKGRRYKCCLEKLLVDDTVVVNNRKEVWDMVYIKDVIQAVSQAIEHITDYKYEVFNIGSGNKKEIGEVVEIVKKYRQVNVIFKNKPVNPFWCNISKAKKMLGYKPMDIEDAIDDYFAELKE